MTWMNEWVNERMHVMTWNDMKWHEMTWMNERTDCLMSELPAWATSSLCDLFAAAPPLSAAASLSSFLSGLRLPWTASDYLFCSFCNPILFLAQLALCFLQPPAAIPHSRRMAASLTLSCAQPCHRVLSQPVANRHSRSIAPNPATFAQLTMETIPRYALLRMAQSFHVFFSNA